MAIAEPGSEQHSRDPERTPMQFDSSQNAGFSGIIFTVVFLIAPDVQPWLPISRKFEEVNVEVLSKDSRSILSLVKMLLRLRAQLPALHKGRYEELSVPVSGVFAYRRICNTQAVAVLLNFDSEEKKINLGFSSPAKILISTEMDAFGAPIDLQNISLRRFEGIIVEQ